MNLNDYHTFVIVVKQQTITGAAKVLDIPKSTVSRRLKRLEANLNVELFTRSPKRIVLTQDGQALFDRIVSSIDEIQEAQTALSENQTEPSGILRVTTTEGYGQTPAVLDCFASYMARYPKVSLDLLLTSRVTDMVEERIDVGLRLYTGTLPGDANTMSRRLHTISNGIFASPVYLEKIGRPKSIHDLLNYDSIGFTAVSFADKPWRYNGDFIEGGLPMSTPRFHVNNSAALVQSTVMGLGLCILDIGSAQFHVDRGDLVRVLPEYEQDVAKVSLVWMASKHLSVKVRSFINHAVECLSS